MKKVILIVIFLVAVAGISKIGFNTIYDKANSAYIDNIIHQDLTIKKEYGNVEKYKVYKAGKTLGRNGITSYYDFSIGIDGSKKSGRIYLKLYKEENGKLERYEVEN